MPPRSRTKKAKHTRITREQLSDVARDVARLVERLVPAPNMGKKKRKIAIDMINALVDLPFIGEETEAQVIGKALDVAVRWLNKAANRWDR